MLKQISLSGLVLLGTVLVARGQSSESVPEILARQVSAVTSDELEMRSVLETTGDAFQRRKSVLSVALQTTVDAPSEMIVGRAVPIMITVSNEADFESKTARVYVAIPPTIELVSSTPRPQSSAASQLEFVLHPMGVGEKVEIQLEVMPNAATTVGFKVVTLPVFEQPVEIEVRAPSLTLEPMCPVAVDRYEPFSHGIEISNPGPGAMTNVHVVAQIPPGMNVAKLNRDAQVDLQNRTIRWQIDRLVAGEHTVCSFVANADRTGAHTTQFDVDCDQSSGTTANAITRVEMDDVGSNQ